MPHVLFSKIWILILLVILVIAGGIFAWQYFGVSKEEVKEETAGWKTYRNEEYKFEIDYPYNTNVKYGVDSFEAFLPLEPGTRLFEKVFTINVREEEYDQSIEYYCAQGIPHTFITAFNDIDFCKSEAPEKVEGDSVVRRFTYHTIHNKKWITLSFRLSSCIPRSSGDACSVLAKFDEGKEKDIFNQMLSTFRFLEIETAEEKAKSYIKVISPNGGESWKTGRNYPIKVFCSEGVEDLVTIVLLDKRGGATESCLTGSGLSSCIIGSFPCKANQIIESNWSIPSYIKLGEKAFKVEAFTDLVPRYMDTSDNYFSIIQK